MKKRKRGESKDFSFKQEYKESWNYLKKSQNFIYIIMAIFFLFALIGFFIPIPESLSNQIIEFIKELLEKTSGMGQGELINFIFINNFKASFFGIIFGFFLGVFPIIIALVNGYVVGFVASIAVQSKGLSILWSLVPHGIFELPAVFISLGLGLKLGMFIFEKEKIKIFKESFSNSLKIFLLIVVPLLIIAAIIEGTLIAISS